MENLERELAYYNGLRRRLLKPRRLANRVTRNLLSYVVWRIDRIHTMMATGEPSPIGKMAKY